MSDVIDVKNFFPGQRPNPARRKSSIQVDLSVFDTISGPGFLGTSQYLLLCLPPRGRGVPASGADEPAPEGCKAEAPHEGLHPKILLRAAQARPIRPFGPPWAAQPCCTCLLTSVACVSEQPVWVLQTLAEPKENAVSVTLAAHAKLTDLVQSEVLLSPSHTRREYAVAPGPPAPLRRRPFVQTDNTDGRCRR
jgi:hypothetical protein